MKKLKKELDITEVVLLTAMLTITLIWSLLLAIPVGKSIYENCSVMQSSDSMDKHVCTSNTYYTQR